MQSIEFVIDNRIGDNELVEDKASDCLDSSGKSITLAADPLNFAYGKLDNGTSYEKESDIKISILHITSSDSKIPSLLQIVPVSILDDDNNSSAMFSNDLADTEGSLLPCLS
ncbi:hypothetical protein L1887_22920 [Cichorium endivia]|nr:hypothetical protein L1887_22920 [Cichorium endivia]